MAETTFELAVPGDNVWGFGLGWGKITTIIEDKRICVVFNEGRGETWIFSFDGRLEDTPFRILFWDEIKFVAPPKPKKKSNMREVDCCHNCKSAKIYSNSMPDLLCLKYKNVLGSQLVTFPHRLCESYERRN